MINKNISLSLLFFLFSGCANITLDKVDKNLVFQESITDSKLLKLEKGQVRKVVRFLKPQMGISDGIIYNTTLATKHGGAKVLLKEELCIETLVEFAKNDDNEIIFLQTKDDVTCNKSKNKEIEIEK